MTKHLSGNFWLKRFSANKKILVIFAIFLTVLILGLEFLARKTIIIAIDEQGFHPTTVNIQPGQKLVWRNTGIEAHWPASNNHPTHTQYITLEKGCLGSALDACKALKSGETFEFVFDNPGSWGMHDHIVPGNVMSVNVANVRAGWVGKLQLLWRQKFSEPKKTTQGLPAQDDFRVLSYSEQLDILRDYASEDPEAAWKYLKDAFIVNGQTEHQVHEFGHIVGNSAYKKLGMSAVKICDASFAYSCYHGVAEKAVQEQGEQAVTAIERACMDQLSEPQQPSCFHGVGHGVAGMFKLDLQKSLKGCDIMGESHREYCYDGVMMEQASAVDSSESLASDPWIVCRNLEQTYHIACGRYQPARLGALGWDHSKIINSCSSGPSQVLKEHCFRSSGFAAASLAPKDANAIIALCEATTDALGKGWCLISAATEVTFQRYSDSDNIAVLICAGIKDVTMSNECKSGVEALKKREGS